MDQAYTQEVIEALKITLTPTKDNIAISEKLLDEILPQKGPFPAALMMIGVDANVDMAIRKAAVVLLVTELKARWVDGDAYLKILKKFPYYYPQSVKDLVRSSFLDAMILANDKYILKQLGESLRELIRREEPDQWPELDDMILAKMTTDPTPEKVYSMLVAFHARMNAWQYLINTQRVYLNTAVSKVMPSVLELLQNLLQDPSSEINKLMIKQIVKTMYKAVHIDMPPTFRDQATNQAWMTALYNVMKVSFEQILALAGQGMDGAAIQKDNSSKVIKWVYQVFNRYIYKYGNSSRETKDFKDFAAVWEQETLPKIWNISFEIIKKVQEMKLHRSTISLIIRNLSYSQLRPQVYTQAAPQIELLCTDVMLKLLEFTELDQEVFNDNPVEYFRQHDSEAIKFTMKREVIAFINDSITYVDKKMNVNLFEKTISKLKAVLDPTSSTSTIVEKEAALQLANRMEKVIFTQYAEKGYDFFIVAAHALLGSEHGFVRMTALKSMFLFMYPEYSDQARLTQISEVVIPTLKDGELAVRSAAAQALQKLLQVPCLKEHFKPHLTDILLIYIKLVSEFESDTLLESFKDIFIIYKEEIGPFASDLVKSLYELFETLVKKEQEYMEKDDDEGNMESGAAGMSCLNNIEEIFRAPLSPEVLEATYPYMEKLMHFVMVTETGFEYCMDVAGIFNCYLGHFKHGIPGNLWAYPSIFCYMLSGNIGDQAAVQLDPSISEGMRQMFLEMVPGDLGCELFSSFTGIFRNYISLGADQICNMKGLRGENLIDLMIETIKDVIQRQILSAFNSQDIAFALMLCGFMVGHLGSKLGDRFGAILDIMFDVLKENNQSLYLNCAVYTVGVAMYAERDATITYLNQNNRFAEFLAVWVKFHRGSIIYTVRKGSFLGLLQLFSLPQDHISQLPVPLDQIFKTMVRDLQKLSLEQEDIALGNKEEEEDMFVNEDFAVEGKDIDDMIKDTEDEIDELRENTPEDGETPPEFVYDDYITLTELENFIYYDKFEEVNEVLQFEATLQGLQTSNPELYNGLASILQADEALSKTVKESVDRVKNLPVPKKEQFLGNRNGF